MTPQTKAPDVTRYTPDVESSPARRLRLPRPTEIASALALATALLVALGWKYAPSARAIEAESAARMTADSVLRHDVEHNARRIDTLGIQQTFTNYLLCD